MSRAMVVVLSLGLLATALADTANSAPGRRGGGRAAGAARAGSGIRSTTSGLAGSGVRQQTGAAANLGANRPGGPISATPPQIGSTKLPGLQSGSLNVPSQLQNRTPGQLQDQLINAQGTLQDKLSEAATAYGVNVGGPAPFSPAWYAQHPNAWQITHPYAGEAAIAATAVGLASFMAMEAATHSGSDTTVVYYANEATPEQTQSATELAQSGVGQVGQGGPWMPVGVFAFRPMDAPKATRMIQLAVNQQGTLRGSHYDLLSEETTDIVGAVDRNTTQVSWRIGESGHVIFETSLAQLTQPLGQVRVHFPDGQTSHWTVTQLPQ